MMKILVPVTSDVDIDALNPDEYHTEFFCGYLPDWWVEAYNHSDLYNLQGNLSTPINNRNSRDANVTTLAELKHILSKADSYGTDVFLALNAKYYPEYVYPNIRKYLDEVISAGVTRMIVCDIGMIYYLQENYPQIKVSVSCLNQVTNSMAARFYANYSNVDRIVFPRHMSVKEILEIAQAVPDFEYEYFIFSNKCLYDDGYCRGVHEFTPICKDLFFTEYYSRDGSSISDPAMKKYRREEFLYREWTRNETEVQKKGYCTASFGCAACSLLQLYKLKNMSSVKISIRGHGIAERLRQVRMASQVLNYLEQGGSQAQEIKRIVCRMYGKESLCETEMACFMD